MTKIVTHNHLDIANHSPAQQGMFFGLGQKLGYTSNDLKAHAKKHFKVDCFQKLTKGNMIYLIDKLVEQENLREQQAQRAAIKQPDRKEKTPEERRKEAEEANTKTMKNL